MKRLLVMIGAAMIGFAATVNAEEINLREWLASKGVAVSGCVTGTNYANNYGPEKLFDGGRLCMYQPYVAPKGE